MNTETTPHRTLEEVEDLFKNWRRTRKSPKPMPRRLWEAAPTGSHEITHSYQFVTEKRPTLPADLLNMEVEAKNLGLDVYEQLGKPNLPYDYLTEWKIRAANPDRYNQLVWNMYKKIYGL